MAGTPEAKGDQGRMFSDEQIQDVLGKMKENPDMISELIDRAQDGSLKDLLFIMESGVDFFVDDRGGYFRPIPPDDIRSSASKQA